MKRILLILKLTCAAIVLGSTLSSVRGQSGYFAIDVTKLPTDDNAYPNSVTPSGRLIGDSIGAGSVPHAFRTRPYAVIDPSTDPNDNVHAQLQSLISAVTTSTGNDIAEDSAGNLHMCGSITRSNIVTPYWYIERPALGTKAARPLSLGYYGTAGNAVKLRANGTTAATVVGHIVRLGQKRAAYWEVSDSYDYLYDHGGFYPSEDSYFTDLDGTWNRCIGYRMYGGSTPLGFLIDHHASQVLYTFPAPYYSYATVPLAMNNNGDIVGYAVSSGGAWIPCLWHYNTGVSISLVMTLPLLSGKAYAVPRSITDGGVIAGSASSLPQGLYSTDNETAVKWNAAHSIIQLSCPTCYSGDPVFKMQRATKGVTGERFSVMGTYFGTKAYLFYQD